MQTIDYNEQLAQSDPALFGKIKRIFQGQGYQYWADTDRLAPSSHDPKDYLDYLTDAQIRKLFDLCIRFNISPAELRFCCQFRTIEVKRKHKSYFIDWPENVIANFGGMTIAILPDGSSHS